MEQNSSAGRGLTVDLRTLTRRTTGVAFAHGLGQRQREWGTTAQGSWMHEEGTGRGAACPDWAWPGKQAGWVAAEAVRTRAGGQSKPQPSAVGRSTAGMAQLCRFSQTDRAPQEAGRRRGLHHTRPQSESPERPPQAPGLFRKDPPKPPASIHSSIHSASI